MTCFSVTEGKVTEGKSLVFSNLEKKALLQNFTFSSVGSVSQVSKVSFEHKSMSLNGILSDIKSFEVVG